MKKLIIFDIFGVFYNPGFLLGGSYDLDMIALALKLKEKGIRVVGMTNSIGSFSELDSVLQKKYVGSLIGLFKPDKKFFEYVLKEEGVEAENCVFFDDSFSNVEAGQNMGIQSFLFKNAKETEEKLERFF